MGQIRRSTERIVSPTFFACMIEDKDRRNHEACRATRSQHAAARRRRKSSRILPAD